MHAGIVTGSRSSGTNPSRNWYVDNSVGASGTGLTFATAWKLFSDIVWASAGTPGDTTRISGGTTSKTYTTKLETTVTGTAARPVTIRGSDDPSHSGEVILDWGVSGSDWVYLNACSHMVLERMTVRNGTSGGSIFIWNCTGGVILRNLSVNGGDGDLAGNGRGFDVRSNTAVNGANRIQDCIIHTDTNTTSQTDGIYGQGNGHGALEIIDNDIYVDNVDTTGHSDNIQLHECGSTLIRGNFLQGPTAGGDNHNFWISDISNSGTVTIEGNTSTCRNGGFNVTVWRSGAGVETGGAIIDGNTITGGERVVNIERNDAIVCTDNTLESDDTSTARVYFIALLAIATPANFDRNHVVHYSQYVANYLGADKTWAQWQALGFDLNSTHEQL